jgi:putative holliday junction resolvase
MVRLLPPEDRVKRSNMNILGVDFGTKRIGLAWMQTGLDIVLPFGVVERGSQNDVPDALLQCIKTEKITKIVLGLPYTLEDKSENQNTQRVREFAKKLADASGVLVVFTDERLTSFEADNMGGEASRDEKAAMAILHTYKDEQGM